MTIEHFAVSSTPDRDEVVTLAGGRRVAVLDALHLDACTEVGWSAGAHQALALGALHPERVDRMVLACGPGTADDPELLAQRTDATERVVAAVRAGAADALVRVVERFRGLAEDPETILRAILANDCDPRIPPCRWTPGGDPHPIGPPTETACPSWRTSIINELAERSWQRASRSPRSSRPPTSGTRTATQGHPARLLPRTAKTNDVDVRTMTSAMNRAGRVPVAATLAMVAAASMSTAARRLPSRLPTEPPM
ncbi:MAG: alpha/beta fold hydrolase [Nitriliruptoraceae bacterium]